MADRASHHLLKILEERLVNRAGGPTEPSLETLLTSDFCEITHSGRLSDKTEVVSRSHPEGRPQGSIQDFQVRFLAPDIALLIYLLVASEDTERDRPPSWHSAIWHCRHGRWQCQFHQETLAPHLNIDFSSLLLS
jgi:hypothetical protein